MPFLPMTAPLLATSPTAAAQVVLHVLDASAPNAVAQCDAVLKVRWARAHSWGTVGPGLLRGPLHTQNHG